MHVRGFMGRISAQVAAHPRGDHLPVQHPHHLGLRRLRRLQLPAPGPERQPERRAARRAEPPVPGGGAQAAGDRQHLHVVRPALSPGQGGARPREGAQAGRPRQRGVPGPRLQPGRQLRERLQPVRPPLPRLRPGGGGLPAQARRHRPDLRPQHDHGRHDPARHAHDHHLAVGHRAHEPLQPAPLGRAAGRARARASPPGRPSPRWRPSSRRRCPRRWASPTPRSPTRRRSRRPPRRPSWPPSSSSSCSWPPCTRAGACPGRCCWARRSWPWGPSSASGSPATTTTSTSRSATSCSSASPPRTPSSSWSSPRPRHDEGMSVEEAALESARLRFRPILMTAFAFILGVVPLMRASGAGAGAQNVMGTAVFWGMLVATALGVFLIPGNFAFVEPLGRKKQPAADAPPRPAPTPAASPLTWLAAWPPSAPRPPGRRLRAGSELQAARGARRPHLARPSGRGGREPGQHALVGGLRRPPAPGADHDRPPREQGPQDRGRAHRRGAGAIRLHQGRPLAESGPQRDRRRPALQRRQPPPHSRGRHRRRGRTDGDLDLLRDRRTCPGRSTSSAASAGPPRPRRPSSSARRRRGARRSSPSSRTWPAPTSSCATSTAGSRSPGAPSNRGRSPCSSPRTASRAA